MINFSLFAPTHTNYGPNVTLIGQLWGKSSSPAASVGDLDIPWQDLQDSPSIFSLLSWHTMLSDFHGRQDDLDKLNDWANSRQAVSVKFLIGDGGTGKSRLAAEFATDLKNRGWAAGFCDLRKDQSFKIFREGCLLIVDYPEENREAVIDLMRSLANIGRQAKFRLLFLTRKSIDDWYDTIQEARADVITDFAPVNLGRFDLNAAHEVYYSTLQRAGERFETDPLNLPKGAFEAWFNDAPENNRPLFILALAVHNAMYPEKLEVNYKGAEVINALVDREVGRLRNIAKGFDAVDDYVFARLLAMAAISGGLSIGHAIKFLQSEDLILGAAPDWNLKTILSHSGLMVNSAIPCPTPDILSAAFVAKVLGQDTDNAPKLIWAAMENNIKSSLENIARLSYDSEITLGGGENRLSYWLEMIVGESVDRAQTLANVFSEENYFPLGWNKISVRVWNFIAEQTTKPAIKAMSLNNLSNRLDAVGDPKGALAAIEEAVEIYRQLAGDNPARFTPDLATSLGAYGLILKNATRITDAILAFQDADRLIRPFAEEWPESPYTRLLNALEAGLRECEEKERDERKG